MTMTTIEEALAILTASPDYRIIRRMADRPLLKRLPEGAKKGVIVDVEATGSDVLKDEIIELGMVSFAFTPEGELLGVIDTFSSFRDPGIPISAEITALTGIDDSMVSGAAIDGEVVSEFVKDADIVIAHNADYDRKMVERLWSVFIEKCWACTMSELDWKAEGYESMKLGLLLMQIGQFHDGHRAVVDCMAVLELLAHTMPRSNASGLTLLLESARKSKIRISAVSTPFEMKDLLKQRGYRWTGEERKPAKSWQKDMLPSEAEAEVAYLRESVYKNRRDPVTSRVSAYDRFSVRA